MVEGYVLEGSRASLQGWDQASGLESGRGQRRESHPAEPMAQFAPASQIVRVQHAGPVDVVIQADLVLDSVAREDILRDKCQVPYAQLVPELFGQLAGQRGSAWLAEAHPPAGQEPVSETVHRAEQDFIAAADDRRRPQVEGPAGPASGDVRRRSHIGPRGLVTVRLPGGISPRCPPGPGRGP